MTWHGPRSRQRTSQLPADECSWSSPAIEGTAQSAPPGCRRVQRQPGTATATVSFSLRQRKQPIRGVRGRCERGAGRTEAGAGEIDRHRRRGCPTRPNHLAQVDPQRQATLAQTEVRGTFSQSGPRHPAAAGPLARTLGVAEPRMLTADLLHDALPTECVCANTTAYADALNFPGISGTGFLARRGKQVFYFTAMHCLRPGPARPAPELPTLMIPIRHTGETSSPKDFLSFASAHTIEQYLDAEWQDTVDVIACEVEMPDVTADRDHVLGRCAYLPSSGAWLESFLASEDGQRQLRTGELSAVVLGFPRASPNNRVAYDTPDADAFISSEAVLLHCLASESSQPSCLTIQPLEPEIRCSGFSGAPVFARVATSSQCRYALLGIVITGSATHLNVLRLTALTEAALGDA